jgi:uncharacterized membrane protein YcaP (DUF421 family)
MDWVQNMFGLGLPVLEKILRPIIIYAFLIIGLRLAGKRELAQLNPFDLVVLLTLSNTVQNAIIGDDTTVIGGLIGATTLLIVNWLVVRAVHRSHRLSDLVEGKTDHLIQRGKINRVVLEREDISEDELTEAVRKQGFNSLDEIEEATLDPNANFFFVAKSSILAENRQRELLERLDQLSKEMTVLRSEIARLNRSEIE